MTLTIKNISLENFRNYTKYSLCDIGSLTIFIGPNAIGKTNLLEAIYLSTSLSTFRNVPAKQLIKWNERTAKIKADLVSDSRNLSLDLSIGENGKEFNLNGKKKTTKELRGLLPSVCFLPDDLTLIKGSQSVKRKTIDNFGIQASRNYHTIKKDYEKILQHKNSLLKEESERNMTELIEAVNQTLVTTGTQFYLYRKALLSQLEPYITKHYEIISGRKEEITISYIPSWCDINLLSMEENKERITDQFISSLYEKYNEERRRGMSLIGPHADKIEFYINGRDMTVYGSQGQQRSLVLSIKLAEVEVLQDITGQKPILLLDDVMSELDKERRTALLSFIQDDIQTFITTTNCEYFSEELLNSARVIDFSEQSTKV